MHMRVPRFWIGLRHRRTGGVVQTSLGETGPSLIVAALKRKPAVVGLSTLESSHVGTLTPLIQPSPVS